MKDTGRSERVKLCVQEKGKEGGRKREKDKDEGIKKKLLKKERKAEAVKGEAGE